MVLGIRFATRVCFGSSRRALRVATGATRITIGSASGCAKLPLQLVAVCGDAALAAASGVCGRPVICCVLIAGAACWRLLGGGDPDSAGARGAVGGAEPAASAAGSVEVRGTTPDPEPPFRVGDIVCHSAPPLSPSEGSSRGGFATDDSVLEPGLKRAGSFPSALGAYSTLGTKIAVGYVVRKFGEARAHTPVREIESAFGFAARKCGLSKGPIPVQCAHDPQQRVGGWRAALRRRLLHDDARAVRVTSQPTVSEAALLQEAILNCTEELDRYDEPRRKRIGFVQDLVAEMKARYPHYVAHDVANEGIIREHMVREMKAHGMRGTHIAEQIELALGAFWLLSDHQKDAIALTASRKFAEDKRIRKKGYVSGPWYDRLHSAPPPPKK